MNSTLNIVKIILLSIIAIALVLILIFLLNGKMNIKGFTLYEKTELVYEKDFKEEVNNLKVITTNNDVRIEEAEQDFINVKVYDRKDAKPEAEVKDDTLSIINKDDVRIGFSFGINGSSKIVITVPKNTTYNLDIEGTSSDVNSLINLKNANINVKSGDINLKDSIDTIIKTTSGDIEVGSTKTLDIETKSGDIEINKANSLKLTAISGDVTIDEINNKLQLETTSGDVKINKLNINNNSSIKVTSGDITIGKTNDIYIDTSVISGDTKVNTNNRHAEYELKIKTTSGDITVNN